MADIPTQREQPIHYRGKRTVRRAGIVVLAVCVLMIVAGVSVVADRLEPEGQLLFWAACMLFAFLAILIALVDIVMLGRASRQQRRALFHDTFAPLKADRNESQDP